MVDVLLRPWQGTVLMRGIARAALDIPFGAAVGSVILWIIGLSTGFAVTIIVAVPAVWVTFTLAAQLGRLERSRAAALLDVNLSSPHRPLQPGGWFNRLGQRLRSASRWRELGYLALGLPLQGVLGFLLIGAWAVSLGLVLTPFYLGHVLGQAARIGPVPVRHADSVLAFLAGLIGLAIVAPQATLALMWVDRQLVRRLLGPGKTEALAKQVSELSVRRDAALDSAEADRRQIERDLHDGAQQRLVALAIDLGRARERFDTDPAGAKRLVDEAHEEAKAALAELRDLARGIHPAVLTDRGLDAALSSVVARCPVPVDVTLTLPTRPPAAVESAAYFIVSEALANVAKHARAYRARVTIALQNNRLTVEVADNGVGGADAKRGSGLAGLQHRVDALGGWMRVLSPPKGPTSVVVEVPCGS
jgi:signal transduction histidine kinase